MWPLAAGSPGPRTQPGCGSVACGAREPEAAAVRKGLRLALLLPLHEALLPLILVLLRHIRRLPARCGRAAARASSALGRPGSLRRLCVAGAPIAASSYVLGLDLVHAQPHTQPRPGAACSQVTRWAHLLFPLAGWRAHAVYES